MGDFSLQIGAFCELAKERARDVAVESVLDLADRIVQRSPVDTGLFRGNWQVRVNGRPVGPIQRIDKQPLGSSMGASERGAALVNLSAFKLGDHVWITNELPYAQRLEYEGYSKQAPNGMLRLARLEWLEIIRRATTKVAA